MRPSSMLPINLLSWSAAYAHAILPPRSMAIVASTTHTSSPNLAVNLPPIPPGFHLECKFDRQAPLDSLGAYMVVIKAIVRLSAQPWSGNLDEETMKHLASPDNRVIMTSVFLENAQPRYVVLALLETAHRMYLRSPGYYAVHTDVLLARTIVGFFYVGPPTNQEVSGTTNSLSLVRTTTTTTTTSNLTSTSGVVVDPDDSKFHISWVEKAGTVLHPIDIYSAAIDGLATAARQDYNAECEQPATGLSWNGRVIFGVRQTGDWKLLCKAIVTTYDLLVEQVVGDKPGMQETEFTLIYDGASIGVGYISSVVMGHDGNDDGGGGSATS